MKINGMIIALAFTSISFNAFSQEKVWISTGEDVVSFNETVNFLRFEKSRSSKTVVRTDKDNLPRLSNLVHHSFNRCGGFILHESEQDALEVSNNLKASKDGDRKVFTEYKIENDELVNRMIESVKPSNIRDTIEKLSSFQTRYHGSQTGLDSQSFLKDHWLKLAQNRNDISVEFFKHERTKQPSVILTVKGSENPEEIIVIGGHGDSISGWFGSSTARSPGADDNASGISSFTEVIRILGDFSYKPKRTVKFMSYAAEEIGLVGSKEIASNFRKNGQNVLGVIQLDMTNYQGSSQDIVMMSDYTNNAQNQYLGRLMDHYLPELSWGYDKCGYACSDHASWTSYSYPSSMPFEARKNDMNARIHTANDTLAMADSDANHAAKFAKLAIAFMVEMSN